MDDQKKDSQKKDSENPAGRQSWASGMGALAEYSVVGFVFPLALVVGFFVGRWIGDRLGGPTVGAVVGVLLGTAAGFYNLWQTMVRLERLEAERGRDASDAPSSSTVSDDEEPGSGGADP